jgi:hypothetical protein
MKELIEFGRNIRVNILDRKKKRVVLKFSLAESYGEVISALYGYFPSSFCGCVFSWEVEGCCLMSALYDG